MINRPRRSLFAVGFVCAAAFASAQMVPPSIDKPDQPFSYYSQPTDEIGVMDAQTATEITPEGSLYTGWGELMFFAGQLNQPIRVRLRTLEENDIPILHYTYHRDGLAYQFTTFAATLDGKPNGPLVDFIRVAIKNEGPDTRRAWFATGMRYQGPDNTGTGTGDNRYVRPVKEKRLGDYRQLGVDFNPDWTYGFANDAFLRDGKAMYLWLTPPDSKELTLRQSYNKQPNIATRALKVFPTTPVGIAEYAFNLNPGQEKTLEFRLPVIPVAPGPDLDAVRQAGFDDYLARTRDFWHKTFAQGMQITLPEHKVTDVFYASLMYDLLARDLIDGNYIQTVNKLHYHAFWLRDASDIVRMYDVTGYPQVATQDLAFFPRWQQPDGLFLSQPQQYDAWGQVLWAYGQHFRMTGDRAFAESVMPQVEREVAWLKQARAKDPLHLIPASFVLDNEYVKGHITGYNFLALAGLQNAILMAEALGRTQDAADFRQEYADYRATFLAVLDRVTAQTGGYIPPALDTKGGQDWGNLLGTYPEHVLAPFDPKITATLKTTQAKYQEGIMTYGDGQFLHHYLTIKNTLTEVARDEQQQPVKELYGLLMHTSSTQAGFEYAIHPWGDRDFEGNLSPHGWFAADYRTLLRNMLVREDGTTLHLLTVVSPEWIGAGKTISVRQAPTEFGAVAYDLTQPDAATATLALHTQWHKAPQAVVLHLPWFMDVSRVTVDGKPARPSNGAVTLPPQAQSVTLHWTRKPDAPDMSYDRTVQDYKREYAARYARYISGKP